MVAWVKEFRRDDLQTIPYMRIGKWKRYISNEEGGHGLVCGMGMLLPGEEFTHTHAEEEVFFVLEGHGEASWVVDGVTYSAELKPGVAFYKTADIPHTMKNTGTGPMLGIFSKV